MIPGLPRWSPDGKQIAFVGAMPGERFKAYVISAEGGSAESIPSQESVQADPTWSPDGNSIIFGDEPLGQLGAMRTSGFHIVDLKTHQTSVIPGSENLWSRRVSPDGRYILGLYADNQRSMLFDWKTHTSSELVKSDSVGWPEWSHDSQYVYFRRQRSDEPQISFQDSHRRSKTGRNSKSQRYPAGRGRLRPMVRPVPGRLPAFPSRHRHAGNLRAGCRAALDLRRRVRCGARNGCGFSVLSFTPFLLGA